MRFIFIRVLFQMIDLHSFIVAIFWRKMTIVQIRIPEMIQWLKNNLSLLWIEKHQNVLWIHQKYVQINSGTINVLKYQICLKQVFWNFYLGMKFIRKA